jgi:hypothetical protein
MRLLGLRKCKADEREQISEMVRLEYLFLFRKGVVQSTKYNNRPDGNSQLSRAAKVILYATNKE